MIDGVFINLARSPERRSAMEQQLAGGLAPYDVRRLDAIDGAQRADCPRGLRPAQYGCWLSHLEALRASLGSTRHLHVMEDDALLSGRLLELPDIVEVLDQGSDGEWDLLYLDATLPEIADMTLMFEWTQLARERGVVHVHKVPVDFTIYGAHSYLVNSRRKQHVHDYLAAHLGKAKPFDDVLAWGVRQGKLAAHLCSPFITSSLDLGLESTLGESGDDRYLAWFLYRRLCFADLTPDALAALEDRLARLVHRSGRAERLLGELMAHRISRWPRMRFRPEMDS